MNSYMQVAMIFLLSESLTKAHDHFGYTKEEQAKWKDKHKACGGNFQSPININISKAIKKQFPDIDVVHYDYPLPLLLVNNGHSASLSIDPSQRDGLPNPYIIGGPLENEYDFQELHFHWGDKNSVGSEHTINGVPYAMEMHVVHKNRKYRTMEEAKKNKDGLAVLGFLFRIYEFGYYGIDQLVQHLPVIYEPDGRLPLAKSNQLTLESLLPSPVIFKEFFTYEGSLTTPPCLEVVTWIVFANQAPVSNDQLSKFRSLYTHDKHKKMLNNFRYPQNIGSRKVYLRLDNRRSSIYYNRRRG